MSDKKIVVDGSNIATEGRSLPSLAQLVDAVSDFQAEFPGYEVIVVVDATFGHRIDPSERAEFEAAEMAGELLSPPAGAIGRGDAFLLRIADRTGAMVLSNDSFQEFHGEFDWLFTKGRLLGGKPVPGVGWIFTPRAPVRGPKSRESVKEAKRSRVETNGELEQPKKGRARGGRAKEAPAMADKIAAKAGAKAKDKSKEKTREGKEPVRSDRALDEAIALATEEVEHPNGGGKGKRRRRRRGSGAPSEPVNEPLPFITFVSEHPPGSQVEGEVESFSSHGAFVIVNDLRCYVPLAGLGDPPPASARKVLTKGDRETFVIQAFDPPRRGIELALPAFAHVSGRPTEETVEAEITEAQPVKERAAKRARAATSAKGVPGRKAASKRPPSKEAKVAKKSSSKRGRPADIAALPVDQPQPLQIEPDVEPVIVEVVPAVLEAPPRTGRGRKAAAATATEITPVDPKPARSKSTAKAPAIKAAQRPTAKKSVAKKSSATKAAPKKAAPKKAAPKKAAPKKAAPKKAAPKKAAPKKAAPKKAAPKKAAPKKAAAKKAAPKKAAPKKAAAKKRR